MLEVVRVNAKESAHGAASRGVPRDRFETRKAETDRGRELDKHQTGMIRGKMKRTGPKRETQGR